MSTFIYLCLPLVTFIYVYLPLFTFIYLYVHGLGWAKVNLKILKSKVCIISQNSGPGDAQNDPNVTT